MTEENNLPIEADMAQVDPSIEGEVVINDTPTVGVETLDPTKNALYAELMGEDTVPQTHLRPNPEITKLIVAIAMQTMDENPQDSPTDIIYLTASWMMRHTAADTKGSGKTDAIFGYYLDAYRLWNFHTTGDDPKNQGIYNEAALSIFDMYCRYSDQLTLRLMLPRAARALHEVVTIMISEQPIQEIMGNLSSMALLSQTVNSYVKAKRRKQNIPYILWLRSFFAEALTSPDLKFMEEDRVVKAVIPQVAQSKRIIQLPL